MIAQYSIAALSSIVKSALWESMLGISTRGEYGDGDATSGEHRRYGTISYVAIFQLLDALGLASNDVLVDLGCGKGRVVCCAATYKLTQVIGVEDVQELYALAQRNVASLRGKRTPVSLVLNDAQSFDFRLGTIFYLFNPFGPETMRAVLRRLAEGLRVTPRPVRIVYVNALHEDEFRKCAWLEYSGTCQFQGMKSRASIWKSV